MSAQHIPGAWRVAPSDNGNLCVFGEIEHKQEGYSENCICMVTPLHAKTAIDQANARLIAAAPELLEALEGMVKANGGVAVMPTSEAKAQNAALAFAREAIAKAKGAK